MILSVDGQKTLLGSDKIGAGMDFPSVQMVVQYRCHGLTLVKWGTTSWERCSKKRSNSGGDLFLSKKSMAGDEGDLSVTSPHFEDPALLDLIHLDFSDCLKHIVDHRLENPPRYDDSGILCVRCRTRCSNCNPTPLHRSRPYPGSWRTFQVLKRISLPSRPTTHHATEGFYFQVPHCLAFEDLERRMDGEMAVLWPGLSDFGQ